VDALARLAEAGFDLAHAFDAGRAAELPGLAALAGPHHRGILVGNTRALWPPFQAALADPALAADPDPLDRYTERALDRAATALAGRALYGHRTYAGAYLPLQRLAVAVGLGALGPHHLVIHPTYGPWFALRAVLLVPGDGPLRVPIALPCRCTASCRTTFERAQASGDPRDWIAVRDACSLQAWRYSRDQIEFHYERMTTAGSRPP
jgi:hypothetical protein